MAQKYKDKEILNPEYALKDALEWVLIAHLCLDIWFTNDFIIACELYRFSTLGRKSAKKAQNFDGVVSKTIKASEFRR